jgi:hypothetical protein
MKDLIKQLLREELLEGKNIGPLYHFTNYRGLIGIIANDFRLKSDILPYVSFTRNKNFKSSGIPMQVRITIDGNTLSNRYRLQSYADVRAGYGRGTEDESEERVSLQKYPMGVDISKSLIKIEVVIAQNIDYDDEMGEPPSLLAFEQLSGFIRKNDVTVTYVKNL